VIDIGLLAADWRRRPTPEAQRPAADRAARPRHISYRGMSMEERFAPESDGNRPELIPILTGNDQRRSRR